MRHNTAFRKPLLLALGAILITAELAVAAAAALSLSGHSPASDTSTPAAVLGASATPTHSAKLATLPIEPYTFAESVTGGDQTATPAPTPAPTPDPTPAPDPTGEPVTQAPAPVPAAVYIAPTPVPAPPPRPTPTPVSGGYRPDLSDQLYGLLNNVRTANGLQAVSPNDSLIASAQFYTQYIFVDGNPYQLDHWLAGGPSDRAWARGYCCAVGEILIESEGSAQSMVDLWMNSDPHRGVILDPQYKSIGIACYGGPYAGADGNVHNPVVCSAEFGSG
jgi:Uncharacterized protein with SCP/PR1 domains